MEDLVFIGSGFGIVMGVLAALWGICATVGMVFKRVETARTVKATAAAVAAPAPEVDDGIPPAHVAAIAGAVASLSGAYRVVRVSAPAHVSKVWAGQGRLEQQSGRRTRMAWAAPGHRHAADAGKLPSDEREQP